MVTKVKASKGRQAALKAWETRRKNALAAEYRRRALKAWETRRSNAG